MWGSIISTVGGLLGGMMNRDSAADHNAAIRQMNATKIQTTVKDARKAGIHPLAALGSPVAGSWATPVGQPGLGDAVADGAASIGKAVDSGGQRELLRASIETERAKARNLDADTASRLADAQRTSLTAAARRGAQSLDVANLPHPNGGAVTIKKLSGVPYDPGTTGIDTPQPILIGGRRVVRDPTRWSSGQKATDEFGEGADWAVGGPSLIEAYMRDAMWEQSVREAIDRGSSRMNRARASSRGMGNWQVP